jgi:hypothetical protein
MSNVCTDPILHSQNQRLAKALARFWAARFRISQAARGHFRRWSLLAWVPKAFQHAREQSEILGKEAFRQRVTRGNAALPQGAAIS